MSRITVFSNREEGDPENGLAQPYAGLRDWRAKDERRLPEVKDLKGKYPEAFSQQATDEIIAEQRRAIYPEAYEREASAQYVANRSKPIIEPTIVPAKTKPITTRKPSFHDIPHRIAEIVFRMAHPRKMKAPEVSYIAGTKIKRARMPGFTRTEVRDALKSLLNHL
ncbi:MAG: hypothetical protein NTZ25_01975 [Candidatus Peregrinibacteria bacterium]|nr:hypothetical protein [Candidatus Peregrinibacteria bacterium]